MDYSQLSDFQINWSVSNYLPGRFIIYDEYVWDSEEEKTFNPCTKAEDAWPIIESNKINVEWHQWKDDSDKPYALNNATMISRYDDNPLRAAMIVFLMMQDKADANP